MFIAVGFFCVLIAGSNPASRDDSDFLVSPPASTHDRSENESVSGNEPGKTSLEILEKRTAGEESAEALAHLKLRNALAVISQEDLPALPSEELKILHAKQQQEIDYWLSDLNAVVIEAAYDGDVAITVLELRALHERQASESNSVYDGAEIIIPASEDGSPALSLLGLRAMHKKQQQNNEALDDAEHIVIPGSEDGSDGLSRADLEALHAQQRALFKKNGDSLQDYAAPLPKAGDAYLTADDLQALHNNQALKQGSD